MLLPIITKTCQVGVVDLRRREYEGGERSVEGRDSLRELKKEDRVQRETGRLVEVSMCCIYATKMPHFTRFSGEERWSREKGSRVALPPARLLRFQRVTMVNNGDPSVTMGSKKQQEEVATSMFSRDRRSWRPTPSLPATTTRNQVISNCTSSSTLHPCQLVVRSVVVLK